MKSVLIAICCMFCKEIFRFFYCYYYYLSDRCGKPEYRARGENITGANELAFFKKLLRAGYYAIRCFWFLEIIIAY